LARFDVKLPHLLPQNLKSGLLARPFSISRANYLVAVVIGQLPLQVGLPALAISPVMDL
jgi:hypothetical protein